MMQHCKIKIPLPGGRGILTKTNPIYCLSKRIKVVFNIEVSMKIKWPSYYFEAVEEPLIFISFIKLVAPAYLSMIKSTYRISTTIVRL
jgi:hypothetical protein